MIVRMQFAHVPKSRRIEGEIRYQVRGRVDRSRSRKPSHGFKEPLAEVKLEAVKGICALDSQTSLSGCRPGSPEN